MTRCATVTERDLEHVDAFRNFLSWGEVPVGPENPRASRNVPPAWFAYALGYTTWCPPKGTL